MRLEFGGRSKGLRASMCHRQQTRVESGFDLQKVRMICGDHVGRYVGL